MYPNLYQIFEQVRYKISYLCHKFIFSKTFKWLFFNRIRSTSLFSHVFYSFSNSLYKYFKTIICPEIFYFIVINLMFVKDGSYFSKIFIVLIKKISHSNKCELTNYFSLHPWHIASFSYGLLFIFICHATILKIMSSYLRWSNIFQQV